MTASWAGPLFGPLFVPDSLAEALSDEAYLAAMLEFEAALAAAEARAGVIPEEAATAIAQACDPARFDVAALGRAAVSSVTPVAPLAKALRAQLAPDAAAYAHWGATSQDVLDTATMLVARRALHLVLIELDGVAGAAAALAGAYRRTLMAGRTLLQQALPVTFGLKAAGWLVAVLDARRRLIELRASGLAVQLGGAAGTLAALGDAGERVLAELAAELDLPEPALPWHTARGRVGELAGALAVAAGALGKVALDLVLLAQTEVGEVAEADAGGSSTLPHKRNPGAAVRARACALRAQAAASAVLGAMAQEHERAAGAWQAEWEPLRAALALTGGAAAALREALDRLEVDPERMRANLDATGGLLMTERVTLAIAARAGRDEAADAVKAAGERVTAGQSFRDALLAEPIVADHISPQELDTLLDPSGYLGSADVFVDRALDLHRREVTT
jgi:3-carboxy-cis,cis-muconate cycloisomerase